MKVTTRTTQLAAWAISTVALGGFLGHPAFAVAKQSDNKTDNNQLAPIIVIGMKRAMTALDTPALVTVFDDKQIKNDGITTPGDFLHMIPNVTFFDDDTSQVEVTIRGQGAARTADQSVAFVQDGVSLTNSALFDNNLFDIQQIEVYKGPQSTIYGRNALAGAVIIVSKMPTDHDEGDVQVGYGNWNTWTTDASYSGPISPTLKFRAAMESLTTDGPYHNSLTGGDVRANHVEAARFTLQYDPSDVLDMVFRLYASHSSGNGLAYNAQFPGLAIGGVPVPHLNANQTNIPFVNNIPAAGNRTIYDGNFTLDYDFGFAKLVSVMDYSYLATLEYSGDLIPYTANAPSPPGTPGTQSDWISNNSFSEDIRLASSSKQRLRWMIGAYYLNLQRRGITLLGEDLQGVSVPANQGLQPPGTVNPTITIVDDKPNDFDYAVYANGQLNILHNLNLGIAGRYDIERKTDTELAPNMINPLTGVNYNLCIAALGPPMSQCSEHQTFDKFTPKVTLTYKTDYGNIYANYGEGFKSGGYNPIGTRASTLAAAAAAGQPTNDIYVQDSYKTETSETYEVGVKGRFLDDRLKVDLAGYHTLLNNEQQFVFFPTAGIQAIESIDKVRLVGFDTDFTLTLPHNIELTGAYGYNHGTITSFLANPSYDGNVPPLALKYTVNFNAAQAIVIGNGATLTPQIEFQRQGPIYWDAANTPGTERNPINLVNANLTFRKGTWQAAVWSKNLFDTRYNSEFVPLAGLLSVVYKGDPRSFGVNVSHQFK